MVSLEVILHKSNSGMLESLSVSWQTVFGYTFMLLHRMCNFRIILECFQIYFGTQHLAIFINPSQ